MQIKRIKSGKQRNFPMRPSSKFNKKNFLFCNATGSNQPLIDALNESLKLARENKRLGVENDSLIRELVDLQNEADNNSINYWDVVQVLQARIRDLLQIQNDINFIMKVTLLISSIVLAFSGVNSIISFFKNKIPVSPIIPMLSEVNQAIETIKNFDLDLTDFLLKIITLNNLIHIGEISLIGFSVLFIYMVQPFQKYSIKINTLGYIYRFLRKVLIILGILLFIFSILLLIFKLGVLPNVLLLDGNNKVFIANTLASFINNSSIFKIYIFNIFVSLGSFITILSIIKNSIQVLKMEPLFSIEGFEKKSISMIVPDNPAVISEKCLSEGNFSKKYLFFTSEQLIARLYEEEFNLINR